MGRLVKLIGSGIGLAHEAIAARRASAQAQSPQETGESSRSAAAQAPDERPPQYVEVPDEKANALIASGHAVLVEEHRIREAQHEDENDDSVSEEGDEEQWDLDDAVEEQLSRTPGEEEPTQDADALMDAFMSSHPPPGYSESAAPAKLPCPVIIPQRRPRDKKRGFVRAYAPVLEDCGIDQETFLDFLKTFHAASKASPWLQVVNIAAMGAGMVPSVIAMGVSTAIQVCVGVAMEVQRRTRSNSFLDRTNNEFFQPRGLYCLIMTYKPEDSATHESVDITQAINKYLIPASGVKQTMKNLRKSSGKTYGEMEMPEAAPLIFPALDALADSTTAEGVQKKTKLKNSQKFVADYFDRRAQAKYAAENPESSLATAQETKFASRYSDPNHPANSGSIIDLLTGGALNVKALKQGMVGNRRIHRVLRGQDINPRTGQRRGRNEGLVKRMLKKDVLYMMIVNLPSEVELAAGRASVQSESQ